MGDQKKNRSRKKMHDAVLAGRHKMCFASLGKVCKYAGGSGDWAWAGGEGSPMTAPMPRASVYSLEVVCEVSRIGKLGRGSVPKQLCAPFLCAFLCSWSFFGSHATGMHTNSSL